MKRNTWQREAVRDALAENSGFVSAQALHAQLRDAGSTIGLATVYRTLTQFATGGEADSLQLDGESLYRACVTDRHHHHLICRNCGRTVEIEAEPVEAWAHSVAAEHGFSEPEHIVDVFGLCAECSARGASTSSPSTAPRG
ncbi:transcriptional repressor [Salinibacterium sp. SYSU T00001]|uniref:Fur family transcriptional regulator n=1 Tax=Homoserinimonas sedimenticola TaxID=2986805 RepID=UPI0022365DBE|nr:transcriptional repressor [Salinibacterium sedimenticola]MCW4385770.1 transcriptional repressor [Salinibacterium sedimenticola]